MDIIKILTKKLNNFVGLLEFVEDGVPLAERVHSSKLEVQKEAPLLL